MSPAALNVAARPDVSIIIVNWNVRELLRACLQSLRDAAGLPMARMQVFVVDNASADGSADMVAAEFPEVELVANADNLGFGRANNQVLDRCTGRHVLLLNPDTRVLDGAVGKLVAQLDAEPDVAVIGCRLLNGDGTLQRWTGGAYPRLANVVNHYFFVDRLLPPAWRPMPLYLDRDVRHDLDVDWVSGACMILRGSALGGRLFNPDYFMYGEDMELCHRLKHVGGRVVYTPRASIIHYQGESMKQQQGDVLLASLKGPRQFYRQMRGGRGLWLYDAVTAAGFGLRWVLFTLAGWLRPRRGYAAKARSSRDLMQRAWRVMHG
jgi:N-acetylglucosaminyl-diphospho-decaprenol L-rhamnosyltransferase